VSGCASTERSSPLRSCSYRTLSRGRRPCLRPAFGACVLRPLVGSGWSVPVAALVKQRLGVDSLLLGFGLPTDGAHAPNEHFDVESLERGIRTMVEFFRRVGA